MGHVDGLHSFPGIHGPAIPHEHLSSPLDDADHAAHDLGDAGMTQYEMLWIDLGGEG